LYICALILAVLPSYSLAATSVKEALSERHGVPSTEELANIAGGEDKLVAELLTLRHDDSLPFISIRAEKILVQFADREDVAAALESDLGNAQKRGLARVVAVHLDSAPSSESKARLARAVISRGQREKAFLPYARTLLDSKDSNISSLARSELK